MYKKQMAHILNEDDLNKATAIVKERDFRYKGRTNWYVKTRGSWYVRIRREWIETTQPIDGLCEIYDEGGEVKHFGWVDEWTHWLDMA